MTLLNAARREDELFRSQRGMTTWVNRILSVRRYQEFCPSDAWSPSINLYEDENQYYVIVDLAGVKAGHIDLKIDANGAMILSGRRPMPEPPEVTGTLKLHLMEIDHGEFCRSIELPDNADVDSIEAVTRVGYLWIRIDKKA